MTAATEQKPQTGCRAYLPTPEEIAAEAAKIRSEWTPAERMKRLRFDWRPEGWTIPGELTGVTIRPEG